MNKLLFIVLVLIGGVIGGAAVTFASQNISVRGIAIAPTPTSIPTPIVTNTPTPMPIITPGPKNPSTRALKVAVISFDYMKEEERRSTINNYSSSGNVDEAIRNLAYYLDSNPERLAMAETIIEKANKTVIIQPQSVSNNIHCTSNTINNYTYTNCY